MPLSHCTGPQSTYNFKFKDPSLSLEERVDDLIELLTLEEKVSQLNYDAPAIERLGIPAYNWWNECLHGVGRAGLATVFPQAIGMAASWNQELMGEIGAIISDEARAKYNEFQRLGRTDIYYGLTFWTPNINIFRDPRWGRGQETYGEDPYLTARLAVPFIKGLQGSDEKYLKLVATAKHFAVHSGPEHSRHSINLDVDNIDLYETYLPAFEATVKEAHVESIMCAYNRFRDEACCGSNLLLQEILRDEWGFEGYVVSDCWAITDFYRENGHNISSSPEEAAALAFRVGTDLNCGVSSQYLVNAVNQGLIKETEIDKVVRRLFRARIRLGMFDPQETVPFSTIEYNMVRNTGHLEKALQASRESIVLLKNNGILPLSSNYKHIAVLGPLANDERVLLGNYNGTSDNLVTPLRGIKDFCKDTGTTVHYSAGCAITEGVVALEPIESRYLVSQDGDSGGLNGRYYDNGSFEGEPAMERVDKEVNFIWYDQTPVTGKMSDHFSVIWEGFLEAPEDGLYTIGLNAGNAAKLYFEDSLHVSFDNVHHPLQQTFDTVLKKEERYKVKIEFFSYGNDPQARLIWGRQHVDYSNELNDILRKSDLAIMFLGLSPNLEGEEMPVKVEGFSGGDRTDIQLPSTQKELIRKVVESGKPAVLVLMGGSAIAVNSAHENLPAVIHSWYPGELGGKAIAEILFGDYNPSGKLPVTFYRSVDDLPDIEDYNMANRTYKYFKGEPLYPFGHGLSYTSFACSDLMVSNESFETLGDLTVSVKVRNTGNRAGSEVLQLYVKDHQASYRIPQISLEGFKKINLAPGEEQEVSFIITPRQLAVINNRGEKVIEPGEFTIYVGGSQPGDYASELNSSTMVLSKLIQYTGPEINL